MAARKSNTFLLRLGNNSTGAVVIGLLNNLSINFTQQTTDITTKSDDGSTKVIGTKRGSSVTADFLYDSSDSAQSTAIDNIRNGTEVHLKEYNSTTEVRSCNAVITDFTIAGATDDVITGSISLTVDGDWTDA